ncbi:hypothetical protein ACLB2K_042140 [Fragaria x ananassa]
MAEQEALNILISSTDESSVWYYNIVGSHFQYVKHRIDELDQDNYVCKYTMIEGDALGDKLESIGYEVKFEAASDGSSICKMTSNYNTIGEAEVKEEEIIAGKNSAMGIYKIRSNCIV